MTYDKCIRNTHGLPVLQWQFMQFLEAAVQYQEVHFVFKVNAPGAWPRTAPSTPACQLCSSTTDPNTLKFRNLGIQSSLESR